MYAISSLGDIGNVSEAVTAAGVLVALGLGGRQLRLTRLLARKRAAARYADWINSREMYGLMSASIDFCSVPEHERDARWEEWRARPRPQQHDLLLPINLFETIAAMYNDGLIDRETTRRLLGHVSLDYWKSVSWFVKRYQELNPGALAEWERMNEDLAGSRQPEGEPDAREPDAREQHEGEQTTRGPLAGEPRADLQHDGDQDAGHQQTAEQQTGEHQAAEHSAADANQQDRDHGDEDLRERGRPWQPGGLFLTSPRQ